MLAAAVGPDGKVSGVDSSENATAYARKQAS
jgi:ubiquinone/menaquinone biosynthesis C-methylase UbiE